MTFSCIATVCCCVGRWFRRVIVSVSQCQPVPPAAGQRLSRAGHALVPALVLVLARRWSRRWSSYWPGAGPGAGPAPVLRWSPRWSSYWPGAGSGAGPALVPVLVLCWSWRWSPCWSWRWSAAQLTLSSTAPLRPQSVISSALARGTWHAHAARARGSQLATTPMLPGGGEGKLSGQVTWFHKAARTQNAGVNIVVA